MDEAIDLRDRAPHEIDLQERLRFAADSLVADFGGNVTADHAEALVFSSAEGLLASASVTEFVPILAERRARHAVRSGATAQASADAVPPPASRPEAAQAAVEPPAPTPAPAPASPAPAPESAPAASAAAPTLGPVREAAPPNGSAVAPVFAVPADDMNRLRDHVDRLRVRVSDWRAQQHSR
ncbi:MAG: three-helix bundle dimerization domain-containing protein [Actinomycetota bacterium]